MEVKLVLIAVGLILLAGILSSSGSNEERRVEGWQTMSEDWNFQRNDTLVSPSLDNSFPF